MTMVTKSFAPWLSSRQMYSMGIIVYWHFKCLTSEFQLYPAAINVSFLPPPLRKESDFPCPQLLLASIPLTTIPMASIPHILLAA